MTIHSKRHADWRHWYELPSGEVYGILEDYLDQPLIFAGTKYVQRVVGGAAILEARADVLASPAEDAGRPLP